MLVAHCTIEGSAYDGGYTPDLSGDGVWPIEIAQPFDYAALGHIHKHQEVGPNIVYSGSLDRINWGERNDPKGYVVIDIGSNVKWQFIDLDVRPMVDIKVSYDRIDNLATYDLTDAIVRVTVTGSKTSRQTSVERRVKKLLQGCYWLDLVNVEMPDIKRRPARIKHASELSPDALLEQYFMQKYPNDDGMVDKLWQAGADIMDVVDRRR